MKKPSIRKVLPCHDLEDAVAWEKISKIGNKTPAKEILKLIEEDTNSDTPEVVKTLSGEKWVVVTDIHRPFHNVKLWDKLLKLIKNLGESLTGFILGGDYLDLFTLGSYNEGSLGLLKNIDLEYEYRDGLDGILELESVLHKNTKKYFLFGNHEDRYFRVLNSRDNAKFGSALKNPVVALDLENKGWIVKTNWKEDYFSITPELIVLHGKYWNIHSTHAHASKMPTSSIYGHTHRFGSFNFQGKTAYNVGGLYDKENKAFGYMDWITRLSWVNGFCIVDVLPDKTYFVNMVECKNDSFLVDGVVY